MIRAVLFDLYETLVTLMNGPFSFGAQLAEEAGIPAAEFLGPWRVSDADRTCGRRTLEEVLTEILRAHGRYS
ncbi:MAG: HAD family hydrolase, partial [Clostridia bacterium]|nr:HAD family hydrolase [Clostridia bacterium]